VPESQRLPADSGEHDRLDDAAFVKIGGFAPQFIAPPEPVPIRENPPTREMVAAGPRWFRRRRTET
jgi:hypothetical protein